jgi:hypothetical protein
MFRSTHRDEMRLHGLKKRLCTAGDDRQDMGGETGHTSRPLSYKIGRSRWVSAKICRTER